MWQKCPICDGEGRITSNGLSSSVHQVCPTCNGARIISELNGLPPSLKPTSTNEVVFTHPNYHPIACNSFEPYDEYYKDKCKNCLLPKNEHL